VRGQCCKKYTNKYRVDIFGVLCVSREMCEEFDEGLDCGPGDLRPQVLRFVAQVVKKSVQLRNDDVMVPFHQTDQSLQTWNTLVTLERDSNPVSQFTFDDIIWPSYS